MKRHKPLVGNPATHRAWQDRSRQTAIQRAQETPSQPKDTGPNRATRRALTRRSGARCELCSSWLRLVGRNVHHRQPRGAGGSSRPEINALSCLLDLCWTCHEVVERNRDWAKEHGLLVAWPLIPADVPVGLVHGRVRLDNSGGFELADDNHDPKGAVA